MHGSLTHPARGADHRALERPPHRLLALALLTALLTAMVGGLGLLLAPQARADAPMFVPDPLTDLTTAQVLESGASDATAAIAKVQDEGKYRLWAVYVDSFDGTSGYDWSDESAAMSSLSTSDVLIAVAVEDRAYGLWAGDDISDSLYDQIEDNVIDALTAAADDGAPWSDAIVAAADTLTGSGGSGGASGWIVLGVVGVGAAGVTAWAVTRKKKGGAAGGAQAQDPNALPTEELVARSGTALVAIDDELRSFEEDLGFAEAQFGSDATGRFQQVLTESKSRVSRAFALRKQLDSSTQEQQRRGLAVEILTTCDQVSKALHEQSAAFEALRQEQANAPQQLQALTQRAEEVSRNVPAARATLDALRTQYPATSLATVNANPDQAVRLVEGAAGALQTARRS